jgi:hypothetical protein
MQRALELQGPPALAVRAGSGQAFIEGIGGTCEKMPPRSPDAWDVM